MSVAGKTAIVTGAATGIGAATARLLAAHEQTQVPAPPDDVGVPSDEELAREEEEQG